MAELGLVTEAATLYHGTTVDAAQNILASGANPQYRLNRRKRRWSDFGQAFYLTTIRSQAEGWARLVATNNGGLPAVLEYHPEDGFWDGLKGINYMEPNTDWQVAVLAHRHGQPVREDIDYTYGPVADNMISVIAGKGLPLPLYLEPGTLMDQVGIHTRRAAERLNELAAKGRCRLCPIPLRKSAAE